MATVFHAIPYGRFIEIKNNIEERNLKKRIMAIFSELVLAIEIFLEIQFN